MRYVKIFLLTFQDVFQERARSFVWFLLSLFGPLMMILFWRGANISSASFTAISSYYFFLVVGASLLMSHSEENIALIDIQEGRLVTYLLKPLPYFILKWIEELPYRLLQGAFGITTVVLFFIIFHIHLSIMRLNVANILLSIVIIALAISLVQTYKMCLGFISFWTMDTYGIFQFSEMIIFVFAGFIVPLSFYPTPVALISYILPFSYMIYFPVASVAGFFSTNQLLLIVLGQSIWIILFSLLYKILWKNGVKAFTGVGQ